MGIYSISQKNMYNNGYKAWGFVVYKTWGYKDGEQERWDMFWKRWNEIMDERLRYLGAVGDLKDSFAGKLLWKLVDHESMDRVGFQEVRNSFAKLVEEAEEHIPSGLDLDMCLVIDKEAMDSLLDRKESSNHLRSREDQKVFVWGVDVQYDEEDEDEGEYPGHFKISTNVLIPELWQTLQIQSADQLYPGEGQSYVGLSGMLQNEYDSGDGENLKWY